MKRIANYLACVLSTVSVVLTISAQAQPIDIDQELSVLAATCPVQWESLDKQLNVGGISENIWQDEADYTAWKTYFSNITGNESITENELQRVGSDHLTIASDCAAQRVKVMLLLGGTPLGESAIAVLSEQSNSSDPDSDSSILLGSRADFPASSCLQVKTRHENAESGYYWIKLGISPDIYHVFCEMEHDGGGWMYWGFLGANASPGEIFGSADQIGSGVTCDAVYPERVTAPRSCRHILENGNANGDGIYQLDTNGTGETQAAWCDMTTDGGGWTYLMHKNTGVLSGTSGVLNGVYLSGKAGQAKADNDAQWYGTYQKCNTSDNCTAKAGLTWSNPIGADQVRIQSTISGNGLTRINGNAVVSIKDDSVNSCETRTALTDEIHTAGGALQIFSVANPYGGCGGIASLSQVSVREPAGMCKAVSDAANNVEPDIVIPTTTENTINVDYDKHRRKSVDETAVQSVFSLNQLADSEMIMSLNSPSLQLAKAQNKYIRYRYAVDSSVFNLGPFVCHAGGFEYSLDGQNFEIGTVAKCTDSYLYLKGKGEGPSSYLASLYKGKGVYWGAGMGGNNTWNHPAWIYVR